MKKRIMQCMAVAVAAIALFSCEQDRPAYSGKNYLMFSDTIYYYPVQESNEVFQVPVSATEKADYDRTFGVEIIDKESNAIEGKHYSLLSNTVTIKAGEMSASVNVEGVYDNIGIGDSLGFALRLVIPEEEKWSLYGDEAKVVLQKSCPFDINNFTGYCMVTSTYFAEYIPNIKKRLIETELDPEEENTVILKNLYYDGFDVKLRFSRKNIMEPKVEMDEQTLTTTGEAFGTIYGDGKLRVSQPKVYTSFYSSCENFVMQYISIDMYNKDGSLFAHVNNYAHLLEWISDAEAEELKDQGF